MTDDGGLANRKLGRVRLPGSRDGLTRRQAERRLRELMDVVQVVSDPDRTIEVAGQALLAQLEAKGGASRTSRAWNRISASISCRSSRTSLSTG